MIMAMFIGFRAFSNGKVPEGFTADILKNAVKQKIDKYIEELQDLNDEEKVGLLSFGGKKWS